MGRADTIKKRAEQRASGKYGGDRDWYIDESVLNALGLRQYKAVEGECYLAILPPAGDNPDLYFGTEIFVHFDVGYAGGAYLCPKQHKRGPCPLCEEWERLRRADDFDKDDENLRQLSCFPPRFVYFILDVKSADTVAEGVQLYDAPQTIDTSILSLSTNKRTGAAIDISDPVQGKNIIFERIGKDRRTRYVGFELEDRRDPLTEIPADFLEMVPPAEDVLVFRDYEYLRRAWAGEALDGSTPPADTTAREPEREPKRRSERESREPERAKKEDREQSEPERPRRDRDTEPKSEPEPERPRRGRDSEPEQERPARGREGRESEPEKERPARDTESAPDTANDPIAEARRRMKERMDKRKATE